MALVYIHTFDTFQVMAIEPKRSQEYWLPLMDVGVPTSMAWTRKVSATEPSNHVEA